MKKSFLAATLGLTFLGFGGAAAQPNDLYVYANGGIVWAADITSEGFLKDAFEPGLAGEAAPAGAAIGFDSSFDPQGFFAVGWGKRSKYGPFRSEIELSGTFNDVDELSDLAIAGQSLDTEDLAFLVGGDPSGTSVGAALGEGGGHLRTYSAMVNAYWDIPVTAENVSPYIGLGAGGTWVDVDYATSGLQLADDKDAVLGYQVMAGFDYFLTEKNIFRTGVRYRRTKEARIETEPELATSDVKFNTNLFILEVGLRRNF